MTVAQQRVLLVEGEAESRRRHRRSLTAAHFEVRVVEDAAQALEDLRSASYELIIMEESVTDRGGVSLLVRVREMRVNTPVILLTGAPDNAITLRAGERDAICLWRPVEEATLVAAARQCVAVANSDPSPEYPRTTPEISWSVSATRAKNEFGRVMDTAVQKGHVVITKHQSPRAVLLSYDEYTRLVEAGSPSLDDLTEEFDMLLARMQSPKVRSAARSLFSMSSEELGEAALAAEDES